MVTFTGDSVDDTANYTCDIGFELIGNATTTCTQVNLNSAAFTPAPPFCQREYHMNISTVDACLLVCNQTGVHRTASILAKRVYYEERLHLIAITQCLVPWWVWS